MIKSVKNDRRCFILASSSSTRARLLSTILSSFKIVLANVDERSIEKSAVGIQPSDLAKTLAEAKAGEVAERYPDGIVIGADQVLELNGDVFHKPIDEKATFEQITRLAGKTHKLHSAVVIVGGGSVLHSLVCTAFMTVRDLDPDAIRRYVSMASQSGMLSSVGGYHFEGAGIALFSSVSGKHSTILGLPLQETLKFLQMMDGG